MPRSASALTDWSRRHGGYDPERSLVLRTWLALVHALARPVARQGISPDAVTLAAVAAAAAGARLKRAPAAALVATSVVLDGVDGSVATQRGLENPWGTSLDHAADRVSDILMTVALRRAGGRPRLCVAAAASTLAFEAVRGALRLTGRGDVTSVTLGDRPARVAAGIVGIVAAPTAGAAAIVVLCSIGAGQLARQQATNGRADA